MKRAVFFLALCLAGGWACSSGTPSADSKSNWLRTCEAEADCGEGLSCICGVCSTTCSDDNDCLGEPNGQCALPSKVAQCPDEVPGMNEKSCVVGCSTADDCPETQSCVAGLCVTEHAPTASICATTMPWSDEDAALEAEALDEVAQLIAGRDCLGATQAVRDGFTLNYDLRCAARLHARAMFEQEFSGAVGTDGVSYLDRVAEANAQNGALEPVFSPAEGSDVSAAISAGCAVFFDGDYSQIAVGHYSASWVIFVSQ